MQKRYWTALALAAFAAAPAVAASPFDGTWKVDIRSAQIDSKPDAFLLKDGLFACSSCAPPLTVKADGAFHPVTGRDYSDAVKVEVVDAHTVVRTSSLKGRTVGTATLTVSPDGKTLNTQFTSVNLATGVPTSGKGVETRIAAAPDGAHLISGSWHAEPLDQLSDSGTTMTLKVDGDTLTLSSPDGTGYVAKFGGPAVVQQADTAHTMIAVAKPAPDMIVETDSRGGAVVSVFTMQLAPDGKALMLTNDDRKRGEIDKYTATKQ